MPNKLYQGFYEWCIECGEAWPIYGGHFNKCYECATEKDLRDAFRYHSDRIIKLEDKVSNLTQQVYFDVGLDLDH